MLSAYGGLSPYHGGVFSLRLEHSPNGCLEYGIGLELMGYGRSERKFGLNYRYAILTAGGMLRYRLDAVRNFRLGMEAGAQAGSDNSQFIWYPYGGLEETWFISRQLGVFSGQRELYVFGADARHWQPFVLAGIKMRL